MDASEHPALNPYDVLIEHDNELRKLVSRMSDIIATFQAFLSDDDRLLKRECEKTQARAREAMSR